MGRAITDDFFIKMRLLSFVTTEEHVTGHQLYRLINYVLATRLRLNFDFLASATRDSCSTNGVAMTHLLTLAPNTVGILCVSHTLHNMGKHLEHTHLNTFMTAWLTGPLKSNAAKAIWRDLIRVALKLFSKVRWWSRFEVIIQIATHFGAVGTFISRLEHENICEATVATLRDVYDNHGNTLKLEMAGVVDLELLVRTTYKLEGDGLEILLAYDMIESIRTFGNSLSTTSTTNLPNSAAVASATHVMKIGSKLYEYFDHPYDAWFAGTIVRMPTAAIPTIKVKYSDNSILECDVDDVRRWLDVSQFPEWSTHVTIIKEAFNYLEKRLTDDCDEPYHCAQMYGVLKLVRSFDPTFAAQHLTAAGVSALVGIPSLAALIDGLQRELPVYLVEAVKVTSIDHTDVHAFTTAVLNFWRKARFKIPTWAKAARIVFSFAPSSGASERIFALVKTMFGEEGLRALSDYIQAALMLRYAKRTVG